VGVSSAAAQATGFLSLVSSCTAAQAQSAIKAGAQVNAMTASGATALMLATAKNTNPEVIGVLLRAGVDVNAKGNNGGTAPVQVYPSRKRPHRVW